jgi:hypothetical protein
MNRDAFSVAYIRRAKMQIGFQTPGIRTLNNFFESVQFHNPALAYLIHEDLMAIALGGISGDQISAYNAVRRVRDRVHGLPTGLVLILDHALYDLGYPLDEL